MSPRERIIEGTWTCTSCDTKGILARHKSCPHCNNPREFGKESDFDYGEVREDGSSARDSVEDARALELAGAGQDWRCGYCHTANRGDKTKCRQCGAQRDEKAEVLEAGADVNARPPPRKAAPLPPVKKRSGRKVVLVLGAVGFAFVGAMVWATRTHEARGTVASRQWNRSVTREHFEQTTAQGWRDELRLSRPVMPVDGRGEQPGVEDVRDCRREQRGTRQVADGTQRVCHTKTRSKSCGTEQKCTTTKMGNGFAKETCHSVTKYCDESYQDCNMETRYRTEPVYSDRCSYTTWRWKPLETARAAGSDDAPRWPELRPGELERASRAEDYTVTVAYNPGSKPQTHVMHPKSETEFLRWTKGKDVKLTVSNIGGVSDVQPLP